jgi:hypothetical protein
MYKVGQVLFSVPTRLLRSKRYTITAITQTVDSDGKEYTLYQLCDQAIWHQEKDLIEEFMTEANPNGLQD